MKTLRMRSTTTTRCWSFPSLVSGLKGGELQGVASAVPCSPRVPHSPDHSPRRLVVVENLISYDGAPRRYTVNLLEFRGDKVAHASTSWTGGKRRSGAHLGAQTCPRIHHRLRRRAPTQIAIGYRQHFREKCVIGERTNGRTSPPTARSACPTETATQADRSTIRSLRSTSLGTLCGPHPGCSEALLVADPVPTPSTSKEPPQDPPAEMPARRALRAPVHS
jgi:hypothetical protein